MRLNLQEKVTLVSLNVRGLKCRGAKEKMMASAGRDVGIIIAQETHLTPAEEGEVSLEMGHRWEMVFSHGDSRSKGSGNPHKKIYTAR